MLIYDGAIGVLSHCGPAADTGSARALELAVEAKILGYDPLAAAGLPRPRSAVDQGENSPRHWASAAGGWEACCSQWVVLWSAAPAAMVLIGADGCGPIGTPTGAGWVAALWQGQRVRSQARTGGLLR